MFTYWYLYFYLGVVGSDRSLQASSPSNSRLSTYWKPSGLAIDVGALRLTGGSCLIFCLFRLAFYVWFVVLSLCSLLLEAVDVIDTAI